MARGGFPGMGNNKNMMKQVQKLQKQMEEMQNELKESVVEASSGGGVVTAKVNGEKEVLEIHIDKEVVDPDDVETLEDLILAAVNEAMRKVDDKSQEAYQKMTGGLNIPGMF